MDSEFPVATIVFLIITIFAFTFSLILFQQLIAEANKAEGHALHRTSGAYEKKQEVANAFSNLIKAYVDCLDESECVCDIYRLNFPTGYSIKAENEEDAIRLSLLGKNGQEIISESIRRLQTGVMENREECSLGSFYIKPDKKGWYLNKEGEVERNYFFDGAKEIYKPSAGEACIITESMSIMDSGAESYFRSMPRCGYKKKKKEDTAFSAFRTFTEEFGKCSVAAKNGDCICDFSRIILPSEYSIRVKQLNGNILFQLYKLKTRLEPEKMLLELKADGIPFIETGALKLDRMEYGCFLSSGSGTSLLDGCKKSNGIDSSSLKALFFEAGKSAGFLLHRGGMLMLDRSNGTELVNRGDIGYCPIYKKKLYQNIWPTEKFNGLYYIEQCFGSGETSCSFGISITQNQGVGVYAVESGIVETADTKSGIVVLKHKNGLRTEYRNIALSADIKERMAITKGQMIGRTNGSLQFALRDEKVAAEIFGNERVCSAGENKPKAIIVNKGGANYQNPACYFAEGIREEMVYAAKCEAPFKGCGSYGNEQQAEEWVKLKVLAIPVNWERQLSYELYANDALEKFMRSVPLKECPSRFSKIFVDGKTDYGLNWSGGSCHVEGRNNCYTDALQAIKACAEQYNSKTGQDYDFVVGIEDSNIAYGPECNFNDRGWTAENSEAIIVEAQYASDMQHELGHKFGLKDQYCNCEGTNASRYCGFTAMPNPLKETLGCGQEGCCMPPSAENYPYMPSCAWCKGNLDMNSKDSNADGMLDYGKKTVMSNYPQSEQYSIEEYLFMKTQEKMQCT